MNYTCKSLGVAYKFKSEQVSTKLNSSGRKKGAITPVANLDPVQLAGTIVRASLYNADQIEKRYT
jgi:DNA ligase (NAD+)